MRRLLAVRRSPQPVYNLTVQGEHVYFANGVLVSNCDCLRYSCAFMDTRDWRPYESGGGYPVFSWGRMMRHAEVKYE